MSQCSKDISICRSRRKSCRICYGSELVIICTPVETICDIIKKIIPHLCKNALVTDVGSVKKNICQVAENLFKNEAASFIGSHPMAGS